MTEEVQARRGGAEEEAGQLKRAHTHAADEDEGADAHDEEEDTSAAAALLAVTNAGSSNHHAPAVVGGGRGAPKRRRRDPSAPKLPRTSYLYYVAEQRPLLTRQHPEFSFREIATIIGRRWKSLSKEERRPYDLKGKADRDRFEAEKLQQRQRQHERQRREEEEEALRHEERRQREQEQQRALEHHLLALQQQDAASLAMLPMQMQFAVAMQAHVAQQLRGSQMAMWPGGNAAALAAAAGAPVPVLWASPEAMQQQQQRQQEQHQHQQHALLQHLALERQTLLSQVRQLHQQLAAVSAQADTQQQLQAFAMLAAAQQHEQQRAAAVAPRVAAESVHIPAAVRAAHAGMRPAGDSGREAVPEPHQ